MVLCLFAFIISFSSISLCIASVEYSVSYTQAQEQVIHQIYRELDSGLFVEDHVENLRGALNWRLQHADVVGLWSRWPFAAHSDITYQVGSRFQNLAEVLYVANLMRRLPEVLILMHLLFKELPACSSHKSQHLMAVLDVLTDLQRDVKVTSQCKLSISYMLTQPSLVGDVLANPPPTVSCAMHNLGVQQASDSTAASTELPAMQPLTTGPDSKAAAPLAPKTTQVCLLPRTFPDN